MQPAIEEYLDKNNVSELGKVLLTITISYEGAIFEVSPVLNQFLSPDIDQDITYQNISKFLSESDARTLKIFLFKKKLQWDETFELRFTNAKGEHLNTICVHFDEDKSNEYTLYLKNITKTYPETIVRYQDENKILKSLFDFVPHPVYIKNKDRIYTYVNKAFCILNDTTKKRIIGNTDDVLITVPEEAKMVKDTDEIVLIKEEDVEIPDLNFTKKNGDKVILFSLKIPFANYTGDRQIMGISMDITNRKKTRKELELTNYELDNFLYHTSHELRSPVKTIMGLLYLAMYNRDLKTYEDTANKIERTIKALDGYINHLTDYLTNKREVIQQEKIILYDLLYKEVQMIKNFFNDYKIRVEFNFDKAITITSDYARLKIVIDNIISNSIKFRKKNSLEESYLHISVEDYDNNRYKIHFADNGIGMEQKVLEKVFDMYFRGENIFGNDSAGLGMYILKETLAKINGEIFVISEVNRGTTVTIILPK
ncbi:MAG: PAS domain-containing sensor histidine kinase [Cytophagales bacterium]|nr:PAS domain-containing sensor histidine kinase [Cytophagales bacterium]